MRDSVKIGRASKESLKILQSFYDKLKSNGYTDNDLKMGVDNNFELVLYNKKIKKVSLYDFAIKSKKIIIEYNGEAWHPNYEKHNIKWLNENWKHKRSDKLAEHFIRKEK